MTQPIKSDPLTLLALGSRMGLRGFEATPAKAANEHERQPVASPKTSAVAKPGRSKTSIVMALAKCARLQCVTDEAIAS